MSTHTHTMDETRTAGKGWTVAFWVIQAMLALAMGMAGAMKTFTPMAELGAQMAWVADAPALLVRFIGVSELAAALGLILPAATRIKPILTPIAAACLVLVMVLAMGTHVMYGEYGATVPNVVLGGLAAFVAWGRFAKSKIESR